MKKEKTKRSLKFLWIGILIFLISFVATALFLGDKLMLEFVNHSGRVAIKSFHILGLDGKGKDPIRDRERKDLENTTAEILVLSVEDEAVYYPEFAFYMLATKKELETTYGKKVWTIEKNGKKLRDFMMADILKELVQLKILVAEAKKRNLSLNEKEKQEIVNTVQEQLKGIDPVLVAKYYLDAELMTKIYEENFLATKFHDSYLKEQRRKGDRRKPDFIFKEAYRNWEQVYQTESFLENIIELSGGGT